MPDVQPRGLEPGRGKSGSDERCASCGSRLDDAVEDQRAMAQVRNAVESLRAGSISTMSAWQAVVDAVDCHAWERR